MLRLVSYVPAARSVMAALSAANRFRREISCKMDPKPKIKGKSGVTIKKVEDVIVHKIKSVVKGSGDGKFVKENIDYPKIETLNHDILFWIKKAVEEYYDSHAGPSNLTNITEMVTDEVRKQKVPDHKDADYIRLVVYSYLNSPRKVDIPRKGKGKFKNVEEEEKYMDCICQQYYGMSLAEYRALEDSKSEVNKSENKSSHAQERPVLGKIKTNKDQPARSLQASGLKTSVKGAKNHRIRRSNKGVRGFFKSLNCCGCSCSNKE